MHNLRELRHLQERQDWLQAKLKHIHTAARVTRTGARSAATRSEPGAFAAHTKLGTSSDLSKAA
ncbi:hypothetical protein Z043_107674 [Scleropages formosus]|uniref:Parathyroid hormone n=1 Tax=Scleropages formosus TaxID=113540 RepID=A0A0P7VDB3_SCLFO|nr:hypothetical protein Z043_107674 [Scleropages formosus]